MWVVSVLLEKNKSSPKYKLMWQNYLIGLWGSDHFVILDPLKFRENEILSTIHKEYTSLFEEILIYQTLWKATNHYTPSTASVAIFASFLLIQMQGILLRGVRFTELPCQKFTDHTVIFIIALFASSLFLSALVQKDFEAADVLYLVLLKCWKQCLIMFSF